jgi:hypothetical protein
VSLRRMRGLGPAFTRQRMRAHDGNRAFDDRATVENRKTSCFMGRCRRDGRPLARFHLGSKPGRRFRPARQRRI